MKGTKVFRILGLIYLLCSVFIVIFPMDCHSKKPARDVCVVIDPGHGGGDPGGGPAADGATWEKTLNLQRARELKSSLGIQGIKVYLTRDTDTYMPIDPKRWKKIKELFSTSNSEKKLFISYHHNASVTHKAKGTETFWRLNHDKYGKEFALNVDKRLRGIGIPPSTGMGTQGRNLMILSWDVWLKDVRAKAILTEICFLDNQDDWSLYNSPSFTEKIA